MKRSKSEPRLPFTEEYYTARSDNGEWYTPLPIVKRVRLSLGGEIDLDPFSCDEAQATVQATTYYTRQNNALHRSWPRVRTLFANPPYARVLIGQCVRRVVMEHGHSWTHGVILVNNATDATWFHEVMNISAALCIFARRIQFTQPQGMTVDRNTRGQVALYVGDERHRFREAFADLGKICEF